MPIRPYIANRAAELSFTYEYDMMAPSWHCTRLRYRHEFGTDDSFSEVSSKEAIDRPQMRESPKTETNAWKVSTASNKQEVSTLP
jgi:hypothetical protein